MAGLNASLLEGYVRLCVGKTGKGRRGRRKEGG